MSGERRLLAALLPPGSVEGQVGALREALFRRHGLVSALALPAGIPLGFLRGGLRPDPPEEAARELGRAFTLETGDLAVERGCLVLRVEPAAELARLREVLGRLLAAEEGFLPPLDGFFLAVPEGAPDPPTLLAGLVRPEPRRFSAFAVSFLDIRLPGGDGPDWWREVYWEELRRIPSRRGRKEP